MTETKPHALGAILRDARIIQDGDIRRALAEQKRTGRRFGEALVQLGIVSREDVLWALAGQLDLPFVRVRAANVDPAATRCVPVAVARRHGLVPYLLLEGELTVVADEPLRAEARHALEREVGMTVNVCLGLADEIREAIDTLYGPEPPAPPSAAGLRCKDWPGAKADAIRKNRTGGNLLDAILELALARRAEAIHVEPDGDAARVRFREAGRLTARVAMTRAWAETFAAQVRSELNDPAGTPTGWEGFLRRPPEPGYRVAMIQTDRGPSLTLAATAPPGFPESLAAALPNRKERRAVEALIAGRVGLVVVVGPDRVRAIRLLAHLLAAMRRTGRKPIAVGRANWFGPLAIPHFSTGLPDRPTTAEWIRAAADQHGDPIVLDDLAGDDVVRAALDAAAECLVLAPLCFRSASEGLAYLAAAAGNAPLVAARLRGAIGFATLPERRAGRESLAVEVIPGGAFLERHLRAGVSATDLENALVADGLRTARVGSR